MERESIRSFPFRFQTSVISKFSVISREATEIGCLPAFGNVGKGSIFEKRRGNCLNLIKIHRSKFYAFFFLLCGGGWGTWKGLLFSVFSGRSLGIAFHTLRSKAFSHRGRDPLLTLNESKGQKHNFFIYFVRHQHVPLKNIETVVYFEIYAKSRFRKQRRKNCEKQQNQLISDLEQPNHLDLNLIEFDINL